MEDLKKGFVAVARMRHSSAPKPQKPDFQKLVIIRAVVHRPCIIDADARVFCRQAKLSSKSKPPYNFQA